jgi:hypothetical protein
MGGPNGGGFLHNEVHNNWSSQEKVTELLSVADISQWQQNAPNILIPEAGPAKR